MDEQHDVKDVVQRLFESYADDVYNMAYYMLPKDIDPKDIVQDVFLRVFEKWTSFRGESSPKTWILRVTRNCIYDLLRKRKTVNQYLQRSISVDSVDPGYQADSSVGSQPLAPRGRTPSMPSVEEVVDIRTIEDAIVSLKEDFRAVLILRTIEQYSVPETAQILNWTESKVRVVLHRARKALKEQLEKEDEDVVLHSLNDVQRDREVIEVGQRDLVQGSAQAKGGNRRDF